MLVKLYLKNSPRTVVVDDFVYEFITKDPYLKELNFEHNLREHSSGRAVFQKSWKQSDGTYKTTTIYLHKIIAEQFVDKEESGEGSLIMIKNGNPLDCRVDNLCWSNRATIQRNTKKTHNKTGYIGVYKSHKKFLSRIYVDRKPIDLGRFETPEEAALAYNKKSIELFGKTRNLNKITEEEVQEAIKKHQSSTIV